MNQGEEKFRKEAEKHTEVLKILRGGWPDFLILVRKKIGTLIYAGIEVKNSKQDNDERFNLSLKQRRMKFVFEEMGIPYIIWFANSESFEDVLEKLASQP